MIRVYLKQDKDKPLRGFHPWVFSGAIDRLDDGYQAGDLVKVFSNKEDFLGIGYLNPRSQIAVRMLTFRDELIDQEFFISKLKKAEALRREFLPADTNAYRLVHSEGDFLPGLILDRYNDYLVVQFLTAGMEKLKPLVLDAIRAVYEAKGVYEHVDEAAHRMEGMVDEDAEGRKQVALEKLIGEDAPEYVEIKELGLRFLVDLKHGQKTGFFLDQRASRSLAAEHAEGRRVLNCFAYTGGFSVHAAAAGATSVTSVEIQERALNTCKTNFELNQLTGEHYQFVRQDVFDFLREDSRQYDLIVLDPPAFCKNRNRINDAARGYKDINLQAMRRISPGGLLLTASCSSYIDADLFQKIIFGAAKDASRDVQIVKKMAHDFDHPVNVFHPEGEYLKGFLLKIG